MKILYVEDHPVFARQVIGLFLARHTVVVAPGIAAARLAYDARNFDLLIVDYDLEDGKGEEFVRGIRAAGDTIPIIAASSHDAGNAALLEAGASAICEKMMFGRIEEVIREVASGWVD